MTETDRKLGDFSHLNEQDQTIINNIARMITQVHRAATMSASEEARPLISLALASGAMTSAAAEMSRRAYSDPDQRITFDSMQASCRKVLRDLNEIVEGQSVEVFEASRSAALKQVEEFQKMQAMAEKAATQTGTGVH